MSNLKIPSRKVRFLLNLFLISALVALIYFAFYPKTPAYLSIPTNENSSISLKLKKSPDDYNVWLIFTKANVPNKRSPLAYKFHNLIDNILNISSVPLKFHIIVDEKSKEIASHEISDVVSASRKPIWYKFYDMKMCTKLMNDIVETMTPFFTYKPGTYYSDALFFISLALHRIAPISQRRAILLDCDLHFKKDIRLVFDEFAKFKPTALFGLAPELNPVYRHVLQRYRRKHKTTFGDYYHSSPVLNQSHPNGFQGYNSGVVLFNLTAIRRSQRYSQLIKRPSVEYLSAKYQFRGHLGDQDFYTLLGYEYPELIQTLNCGLNRQLCAAWREKGYKDVFDSYFKCGHPTIVLHGNCNTKIPY